MNRFNLSFKGEILPGKEPERVKLRFGKMFAIDDPERLERFFSGQTIILRRNLERKVAAEYFQKLRQLGVQAELVKVTAEEAAAAIARQPILAPTPTPSPTPTEENTKPALRGMDHDILQRRPGQVDQSWAVTSSKANRAPDTNETLADEAPSRSRASAEAEREAQKRKAVEEAANQGALQEQAERKAAEEAARREAELAEQQRLAAEEAARQQALQEEAERKAAEEAARREAELAEKTRLAAEEAARQQALKEAAERKAAAEAARKKAEEQARRKAEAKRKREEAQRKKAEEAARREAELAEQQRLAAEEAARQQALKEAAERKAAAEAARKKAEEQARRKAEAKRKREEAQRKKAEEAARRKAELVEKKRKAAEEAARKQAILDEAKRKAAAEAARLKAEHEEKARKAAAEVARLKAEQRRVEAEQAALLAAERAEKVRQQQQRELEQQRVAAAEAAERQARQELQKRTVAAQEAREKARKAEEKRQLAEEAAQRKAEQRRQREEQQAQLRAEQAEQAAQRQAMEEQAIRRAATELAQQPSLKPVKARVKTNLEVGQRRGGQGQGTGLPRRRQKGEPNLYNLRPFRNTPEVRARAEQAHQRMRTGYIIAALALAGLLLMGGRLMSTPPEQAITGASAVVIDPQSRPLFMAGDSLLLHDRSGIGSDTLTRNSLGLDALQTPMAFNAAGELLALGRLKTAANQAASNAALQLLRCNLDQPGCQIFSAELADSSVGGLAIHPLDGSVYLADTAAGELLKTSADGVILARATTTVPDKPVLRLESGLLFMNSALGPAVSVFRYDDSAFGQQLDEILLLPPAAIAAEQTRVMDFVLTGDNWWASMHNPETNSAGLYRFDTQWNFVDQVALPAATRPQQLVNWGEKILVRDEQHVPIQRFTAQGTPEVALVSNLLEPLVTRRQRSASLTHAAWRIALVATTLILVVGVCLGSLQRLRGLVYKAHRESGAEPVDEQAEEVLWVDPAEDRQTRLRRAGISYGILSIALILLAIGQGIALMPLAALLVALSGPAFGLALLGRSHIGHIGILAEQLLLVDHSGMYHLGEGPRIQYRGPFLLIDDVVVFSGSKNLPTFSSKQVRSGVTPLARAGIKVDRTTVLIKLLQGQHPLAQGVLACLATLTIALALLALQGIS